MSWKKKTYDWLDERFGIQPLIKLAEEKKVPYYRGTIWYYFGGIALFLFIVQFTTGVLLLFYYRPGADSAYESVKYITTKIPYGWLVRSIHSWSANILIFIILVHLFSVFFLRSYRRPRELIWYSGFFLLFLALGFGFSGYLLPWNKLAFFATNVGTDIVGVVPLIGHYILMFLRGGQNVTEATLSRFFAVHIFILPILALAFIALHLFLIAKHGVDEPYGWLAKPESKRRILPFFPNFMLRDLFVWMVVLNGLALLSLLRPWELGEKAAPFDPAPAGIRPEWYFVFMFQTLKLIPSKILIFDGEVLGILAFALIFLLWFLTPVFDTNHEKPRKKIITILGVVSLIYIIGMTIWGYLV